MTSIRRLSARALAGLAGAALLTSGASAATYRAYDEFNVSNGAVTAANFAFGYLAAGDAFTGLLSTFSRFDTACAGNAAVMCAATLGGDATPGVYKAAAGYVSGTVFFDADELNLHPGPSGQSAGVQFIAPTAGTYTFKGDFSLNDFSPTGVSLATFVGAANTASSTLNGAGAAQAFNFTTDLAAGERVTFLVGPNGTYAFDSTGLDLTVTTGVPEPQAWALMILGFGGAGALLRRQRLAPG